MRWRLLPAVSGGHLWNMALDEALLESVSGAAPMLRFYTWNEPALSVGYFQDVKAVARKFSCASEGLHVVRRITGGGIVRHGKDLTLSIVLPEDNAYFSRNVSDSYKEIHNVILQSLKPLFPALDFIACGKKTFKPRRESQCFKEPTCVDLALGANKVVGSSQRRRRGRVLHQTAVFLPADPQKIAAALHKGFEKHLGVSFSESGPSVQESRAAEQFVREKYAKSDFSLTFGADRRIFSLQVEKNRI